MMTMEELGDVVKGLYPWFAWLALLGIAVRVRRKEWNGMDRWIAAGFLGFLLLLLVQPLLLYGNFSTSRRYLLIGFPLCLPWAAAGILFLTEFRPVRKAGPFLLAAALLFLLYDAWSPLIRERTSAGKRLEREWTQAAAEFIRRDWNGKTDPELRQFRHDYYQSGRRPLVQSESDRLGYLAGGQGYPEFLSARGIPPDYLVTANALRPPGFELRETLQIRNHTYFIYRQEKIHEIHRPLPKDAR